MSRTPGDVEQFVRKNVFFLFRPYDQILIEELQAQLQRESDEKAKLEVRAMRLQGQNDALRAAMAELAEENARQEVREIKLQAREELRRCVPSFCV